MNITGLIIAIFVSILFLLKFILACFGFDNDTINDVDSSEFGGFGLSWSDMISLKGFLHFTFGFSWSWACFGINDYWSIFAIFIGIICMLLLAFTYKMISKLDSENKNEPLSNLGGRVGTVYSYFKDSGKVIIQIKYNNKLDIIEAFSSDKLNVGDSVIVSQVINNKIIEVKKI